MKIVIDDKIPYIRDAISRITDDAVYIKGVDISPDDVKDADALIVRTRTRCDEHLLGGSSVKFIATATIGYDHLDTDYLDRAGIRWMNCPGCNSGSVEQYLHSVFILLKRHKGVNPLQSVVGVVGCGHVGSKVKRVAEGMGFHVLVNDPPLQKAQNGSNGGTDFVSLEEIARRCDIITFHVPLIKDGEYRTQHLCDVSFIDKLCRHPYIINTSRGDVVDNDALLRAMKDGKVKDAVVDTWENEPNINRELLKNVYIGTPHIAGYSAEGKINADNMSIDGLCRFFGIANKYRIEPPSLPSDFHPEGTDEDIALQLYNPLNDSEKLKNSPEMFEEIRGNYPLRLEKC
jgi:erythronate-4-phosphate dehydrogenase